MLAERRGRQRLQRDAQPARAGRGGVAGPTGLARLAQVTSTARTTRGRTGRGGGSGRPRPTPRRSSDRSGRGARLCVRTGHNGRDTDTAVRVRRLRCRRSAWASGRPAARAPLPGCGLRLQSRGRSVPAWDGSDLTRGGRTSGSAGPGAPAVSRGSRCSTATLLDSLGGLAADTSTIELGVSLGTHDVAAAADRVGIAGKGRARSRGGSCRAHGLGGATVRRSSPVRRRRCGGRGGRANRPEV